MGKTKRKFTYQTKRSVVDEYLAGVKSAAEIATANEISVSLIYKWKTYLEENAKGVRVEELENPNRSQEDTKRLHELETERDAYQSMVGEQAMIIELLKKRLRSTSSQQRSELTGLIETLERAVQKRKRGL